MRSIIKNLLMGMKMKELGQNTVRGSLTLLWCFQSKYPNVSKHKTSEFEDWLNEHLLNPGSKSKIAYLHIGYEGYFGVHKRYRSCNGKGRRVYYAFLAEYNLLLLLGEIKMARQTLTGKKKSFRKYTETRLKKV